MKTRSLFLGIAVIAVSALLINSSPAFSLKSNVVSSNSISMEDGYYKSMEDSGAKPKFKKHHHGPIKGPK